MRPRIPTSLLSALAGLLVAAATLSAQTLVSEVPSEYEETVDSWASDAEVHGSPFHRQRFLDTYADEIQAGQILSVAEEMTAKFEALDWGANEAIRQKILNRLQRFLGALEVALHSPGIDGPLDKKAEQDIFLSALNEQAFGLHSLTEETCPDALGQDVPCYFKDTPDQFLLYEWAEDGEHLRLLLTPEQVRQWRLLENALTNLVSEQVAQVSAANIRALEAAVKRWANFLDRGYSQMPWESLVNGWLIPPPGLPELGPPDHQWVLMHPTVGVELNVTPLDETRVKESLHVEVLGHVWYVGKDLDDYWGLSAAVSLREDLDPGIGVLVHIKRNWNVGITWHGVDEDPFLFFSVDLFRFAKQSASRYSAQYQALRSRLGLH